MIPYFQAPKDGKITPDMQVAYERDGVVVLENMVSIDTCAALMAQIGKVIEGYEPPDHLTVFETHENSQANDAYFLNSSKNISFFFEDGAVDDAGNVTRPIAEALNKIGHDLHGKDPVFKEFCENPAFSAILSSLAMAQPKAVQSMYIFKQPGIGGEVLCHQDGSYMWTEPQSCMGLWFALEDATLENGCLMGLAGGQGERMPRERLRRLAPGAMETEMQVFDARDWDVATAAPLEVKAGTMIVLHGQFPHLSADNKSDKSRHAFALHFIDEACEYAPDNWLEL